MKRKWWILFAAVLVCAGVALCSYTVRVWIAPRWMLSQALGSTLAQLESRFADSPTHMITSVLDPRGQQKIELQLETEQQHLGIVRYDMTVHTQINPNRVLSQGTVVTGGKMLDLSVYLDENFAAVSSRGLVDGKFYGITYDSFSKDIRSRELLAALIGDKTISGWEVSVKKLDEALSTEVFLLELRPEDIRAALYSVLALKPQVSRVATSAGASQYACAVTFQMPVREIIQSAESYRDEIPTEIMQLLDSLSHDPGAVMKTEFLLSKGKLVQITMELNSSLEYTRIFCVLGVDPGNKPINIEVITGTGENYSSTLLEIDTASDEESYQEKLKISQTRNRVTRKISWDYVMDLSSREIDITILRDEEQARLRLNLAEEGECLVITTQDISPLLNLLMENPVGSPALCTLAISPGTGASVPEYRNLDQWSLEDLLELIGGLGSLIGLNLP